MKHFLALICAVAFFLAANAFCGAAGVDVVQHFTSAGVLRLSIHDDINSPLYSWPRTLVSYPVDFSTAKVRPEQLGLTEGDAQAPKPFQLSQVITNPDGTLAHAYLNFFTDLPPGSTRSFQLSRSPNHPSLDQRVTETRHDGVIDVDAGTMKVRLPEGDATRDGKIPVPHPPGPIIAIDGGKGWIGDSAMVGKAIEHMDVKCIDAGNLFRTYELTYRFVGGGMYVADVCAVLDYPFIDLRERMTGLEPSDETAVEMSWTNFAPTKRFAANGWNCSPDGRGIGDPVMTGGSREEPRWTPLDTVEDPSKEMIYHLASFEGNAPREATPVMSFWEEKQGGRELSAFIPDTLGWDDRQYMIWNPSPRLQLKFRYAAGVLSWTWPLVSGTRRTDLTLADVKQGVDAVEVARKQFMDACADKRNFKFQGAFYRGVNEVNLRNAQLLRSWYGALDLDRVKDWVLTYPDDAKPAPKPLEESGGGTGDELEKLVFNSCVMIYPLGLDLMSMNIDHRIIRPIVEMYLRVNKQLTAAQRKRIDAILLLSAYINAGEDLAPIRTCATGTPNMSADSFCVPNEIGMLYPDHPMGPVWRDRFEKTLELMGCYYTRPDVPALGSLGGRWCESFGTYNWAYFFPTMAAQTADTITDGRNRFANFWMAQRGRWMVDELTAPVFNPDPYWRQKNEPGATTRPTSPSPANWKEGDRLSIEAGFERQYPSHGAHGSGTGQSIPSDMVPVLGMYLQRYDPMVAEHLLWAAAQGAKGAHSEGEGTPWGRWEVARLGNNTGTNPHLASCKYTGEGIVLRAGVDTPREVSIHLEQVDRGPNYRWGNNGEGSSGTLYFSAGGHVWSGHERENTGDHSNDDATGNTNFAAVSRDAYRTIGENLLTEPLLNLNVAQFAQIDSRTGPGAYSWPALKSRSVMLVGTDYFVLADDAEGYDRLTWFTAKDLPFPKLVFLQPMTVRGDATAIVRTHMSKGFLRDALGPMITLVTDQLQGVEVEGLTGKPDPLLGEEGIFEYATARGNRLPKGVYRVKTPSSHDLLFRDLSAIDYHDKDHSFAGSAGVIRERSDGSTEMAILRGSSISAGGLTLALPPDSTSAIDVAFHDPESLQGMFIGTAPEQLTLQFAADIASKTRFYIDGASQPVNAQDHQMTIPLPPGRHAWECCAGLPHPLAPEVERTESGPGQATVFFNEVAGATKYRLETSFDGGQSWKSAAEATASPTKLDHLPNGTKLHVRVIASNAERESPAGSEYPVYVTDKPPEAPDGLWLQLSKGHVNASWGQLLGVHEYRLYRRLRGQTQWKQIYSGLEHEFGDDHADGVEPPATYPGVEPFAAVQGAVYEYTVSAVSGNGEGEKSTIADTDPTGWRNWWPLGQAPEFKRQSAYWLPPYVPADETPPLHYPSSAP